MLWRHSQRFEFFLTPPLLSPSNVPPKNEVRLDALRMPPFTRARSGSVGSDDGRLTMWFFFLDFSSNGKNPMGG